MGRACYIERLETPSIGGVSKRVAENAATRVRETGGCSVLDMWLFKPNPCAARLCVFFSA